MSVMQCERSVITMTLHWHSSLVFSLGNFVDDTPTETGVMPRCASAKAIMVGKENTII